MEENCSVGSLSVMARYPFDSSKNSSDSISAACTLPMVASDLYEASFYAVIKLINGRFVIAGSEWIWEGLADDSCDEYVQH